ncbi:multicopper oxidase domain-containing protein [Amycolatopsis sp. NBC_00438]|uniref:multicopper oxidase domain-containing protein n=1 Tax=Amycolatopsis sp. NBC_00438 TaxID=2903558 RepID=UPI002E22FC11
MTEIIERPATTGPGTAPNWGLTKFLDPLRVPPALRPHSWDHAAITIPMVTEHQRLHSQLPPSTLWTYAGHFPGPTIEVRAGEQLRISWSNQIDGEFPLVALQGPVADGPAGPATRPERPARDAALLPRPRDGDHALHRPHGPRRDVPDPRQRGRRARPDSRFYTLNLVDEDNRPVNDAVRLIGTDGGLLPVPTELPAAGGWCTVRRCRRTTTTSGSRCCSTPRQPPPRRLSSLPRPS